MPTPNHVNANAGDVLLLAGTMKGAFVLRSDKPRQDWEVGGPYFPGRAIYAMTYDDRNGRNRLWAAVNSSYWGSYLSSSDDFGKTWTEPETYGVKFPRRCRLVSETDLANSHGPRRRTRCVVLRSGTRRAV